MMPRLRDSVNQNSQLNAEELATLWSDQLRLSADNRQSYITRIMPAVIDFVYLFETELAHHKSWMEPHLTAQSNAVGPMFSIMSEAS